MNALFPSGSSLTVWTLANPLGMWTGGAPSLSRVAVPCRAYDLAPGAVQKDGGAVRIATNDIPLNQIAFFGIAVALLGRNTAIGVFFSALLFAGLITGTSVRNLDSDVFEPALATNLTYMIQGMVVLFVSTDVLVVYLLRLRRRRKVAVA